MIMVSTIKKYLAAAIMLSMSGLFSCGEDDSSGVHLTSSTVYNDERSALSARVLLTLSEKADVYIAYWPENSTEDEALTSVTSPSGVQHDIPLYLLKEQTTYHFKIFNAARSGSIGEVQTFTTAAIPSGVKAFYKESENEIADASGGYYLFHNLAKPSYLYLVDHSGRIVWYRTNTSMVKSARFTANNTLLTLQDENDNPYGDANVILETTLAGDTLFMAKKDQLGFDQMAHHDVQLNSDGHIVAVTNVYKDGVPGDGIIVLNRQGQKVWDWNTFEELTEIDLSTYKQPWINSLTFDTDNNYIISLRAMCQVWKINAVTGDVMWKLGKNGTIDLEEDGFFLFQHFAHRNKNGDLMIFDNGSAARPSSRALSFSIDESSHKATVQLNTTLPGNLYSVIMGSATSLADNNILAASAVTGSIVKMNPAGTVLWQLKTTAPIFRVEHVTDPFTK
jgi:arylsulfate sulfotransferase